MPPKRVFVIGVGMTKYEKADRGDDFRYPTMAKEAVQKALDDAQISYSEVEQAAVGYVFGDSTSGQRALYEVGMTGILSTTSTMPAPQVQQLFPWLETL